MMMIIIIIWYLLQLKLISFQIFKNSSKEGIITKITGITGRYISRHNDSGYKKWTNIYDISFRVRKHSLRNKIFQRRIRQFAKK